MSYFPPCPVFVNLMKVLKMIFNFLLSDQLGPMEAAAPCFSRAEDRVGVTALPLAAEKKTYLLLMTLLIKGSASTKRDIQMSSFAVQKRVCSKWTEIVTFLNSWC